MPARKIFVNLPVRDLEKTKAFWNKLGFEFNAQFSNEKAASMPLSEDGYVMFLTHEFFKSFTPRQICDTKTSLQALLCLSADSRADVDNFIATALAAGGTKAQEPQDHGFMYGSSFYDLDGHGWEVMWMDPAVIQK